MLFIEYVGHIGLRSLTDSHLGRHLRYIKTLNDARVASGRFIKYNASTTRITKEKNLKSSSRSFWFSTGLFQHKCCCFDTDNLLKFTKMVKCLNEFEYFTVFLKNRNFISKIRRSKLTAYAALSY